MSPRLLRAIVAITTMMATFLVILDVTIANVALDHMRGTLSAGVDEITWVLTSFLVANAISLPITGWLTDLLGRKRLFIVATVAFTLTSAAVGAAPSLAVIVIARFLQGLAGGPLVPLSQATMIETFPARQSGMAMAIWGIGIMFAPIIGPTLGGWITDNWSWRWVFYINVPVGAAAVVMGWLFIPESTAERPAVRRVDVPGLVLLVVGVSALQFVLDRGQREDWLASPLIVWLGIMAAVALVALVVRELLRGGAGGGSAGAAPLDVRGGDRGHVRHQHRVLRDHGALAALHPDPHGLHRDAGRDGARAGRAWPP